jgi:2',3'-cyclic-nucleotide 2'-phosphodiesterase (5'-nucleotidase family)
MLWTVPVVTFLLFFTTNLQQSTSLSSPLIRTTKETLRIIAINDVYQLHNFPQLQSLIAQHRLDQEEEEGNDDDNNDTTRTTTTICKTIVTCAGDFLSPSLLSSLDKGTSMVDTFHAVGVTHVCLGNHEADVGIEALAARIRQSHFTWLTTNVPNLVNKLEHVRIATKNNNNNNNNDDENDNQNTPTNPNSWTRKCPLYDIVQVGQRRIALLGLLTDDPSLYQPGAFGDANIEPVIQTTEEFLQRYNNGNPDDALDLIVPLTHQSISEDRTFCQHFADGTFPIICGGHDHEIYDETIAGNRIIKTGMDATHAAIIDIQWDSSTYDGSSSSATTTASITAKSPSSSSTTPHINVQIIPTADYAPDTAVQHRIRGHEKILERLQEARIFRIDDWINTNIHNKSHKGVFSTKDNRIGPSTGTTAIATMIRMGMRVPCAILNAGSVRGNRDYEYHHHNQTYFTWSDLKNELPFTLAITAVEIPGHVLEATIAQSRTRAWQSQESSGAYLHGCSNIQFNEDTMKLEYIAGRPFQSNCMYLTALPSLLLSGLDDHQPLLEWAQTTTGVQPRHCEETGIPAKMLIVSVFSMLLWLQLGSFDDLDKNQDGVVCRTDVKERVLEMYGDEAVADVVVNSIFSVADMSNDGTVTPLEMMIVQFCATDLMDHVCTKQELTTLKTIASQVLGKDPSHDQVKRMMIQIRDVLDSLDNDMDGLIHRHEVMKAIGDFDAEEMDLLQ